MFIYDAEINVFPQLIGSWNFYFSILLNCVCAFFVNWEASLLEFGSATLQIGDSFGNGGGGCIIL